MQPIDKARTQPADARRTLLERYLRGEANPAPTKIAPIPRRKQFGPTPLSYSQHQIWLHSQLAGADLIYNEPVTIHRRGDLNVAALERSFLEVIRRHEAWRTTFHWQDGDVFQIVNPAPERIEIPVFDLRNYPEAEEEALRLATQDAREPFDLTKGPMYRLQLIHLSDSEYRLYLTLHHIIFDGMSLYRVLLPELLTSYEALARNTSPALKPLPIQYGDYAAWQRDVFKEIPLDQLRYWQTVCVGLPVLDLPTDLTRPSIQTYRGAVENFRISVTTTNRLKALSQEQSATLYMTMTAAFVVLLHGHTGQEDIGIGGITSGRSHEETMNLLGCFLNTIVIRTAFSKSMRFTELLSRTREATLGALSHDDVPFELLVKTLTRERDLSRSPLVQALIVVEPSLESLPEGWDFTHLDVDTGTAKFDLQLDLDDRKTGFCGRFIYNTDLFDKTTIQKLKSRWLTLLDQIVATPDERIFNLTDAVRSSVDLATREKPPPQWNGIRSNYPRSSSIQEVFELQAEQTPSAVALVFQNQQLTYDELNRRANRLARQLQESGIHRGTPIGIWMERSIEMVLALLAILKAGGAYVPLDPSYPGERLELMIKDTRMPLILTQRHLPQTGILSTSAQLLCIDGANLPNGSETNLDLKVKAEDLAYIMYTSGSTGTPKGVAIPHRGVVRLVKGTDYVSFSPNETFLQLAPISFDASTFEIWGPLLNGSKLVVMPPGPSTLQEIGHTIGEHRITTLWLTSGLFNAIVDERLEDLIPLRQLLAGGDILSGPHVTKARARLKNTRLINGYGPTESTTFACCYEIPPNGPVEDPIPIGKPIANTTVYILDSSLKPVPIGVTGELFIGGDGLALGYWHQPELARQKFIDDPFSDEPGAKLYGTGDLARWRNDGMIDFLGRVDHQVKRRGYRIEPGEIESVLKRQSDVVESVVIAREDVPGEKRLVAYIVGKPDATGEFEQSSMFAKLRELLPDYMVPSMIVVLAALPRTPNGKIDRAALPRPDSNLTNTDSDPTIPRSKLEEQLATVWSAILGLKSVRVTDNFFELGGHSLSGLRLINRLGEVFGVSVPLSFVFEAPTLARMAELLETKYKVGNRSSTARSQSLSPITPINRESRRARRS